MTEVRVESSPRRFSTSAWPRSRNRSRASLVAGGGEVVAGQPLRVSQELEGARFGMLVTRTVGQWQCLLVAGYGGEVVAGPGLHDALLAEGEGRPDHKQVDEANEHER